MEKYQQNEDREKINKRLEKLRDKIQLEEELKFHQLHEK